jgi:hypothetical protein
MAYEAFDSEILHIIGNAMDEGTHPVTATGRLDCSLG